MTPHILIPAKAFALAKSRLAPTIDAAARAALSRDFLRHVIGVATDPLLAANVRVVSASPDVLVFAAMLGAIAERESASGHNPALEAAMTSLPLDRPVLILSADLPLLSVEDIAALMAAGRAADVVIATDHSGEGSNALWLARPSLIPLRFGPGSCAAHMAQATQAGLRARIVTRVGLARDIDLPIDLEFLPLRA